MRPLLAAAAVAAAVVLAGCGDDKPTGPVKEADAPCRPTAIPTDDGLFEAGVATDCTIKVGSQTRRYTLFEPRNAPRASPLIVALHGVGGAAATPQTVAQASRFDLPPVEHVVAYPEGQDGNWDPTTDVAFIGAMIDELVQRRIADADRVSIAGWSGGGFFAHRLACELPHSLQAIAVLHAPLRGPCKPANPPSVLQIAGTDDPAIPYEGGSTPDGQPTPPVRKATNRWRRIARCSDTRNLVQGRITRQISDGCADGRTVQLLTLRKGGHSWYARTAPPPDDALDATAEIRRFISARR